MTQLYHWWYLYAASFISNLTHRLVICGHNMGGDFLSFWEFWICLGCPGTMLLLLYLLNVSQVLFGVTWSFFKHITQRSALSLESYEGQGAWQSMGKCLGKWSPPMLWNLTPEQMQDPEKLVKYLGKVRCHPGNRHGPCLPSPVQHSSASSKGGEGLWA